jgi:hypothetical protein
VPEADRPLLRPWSNAIVKMYEYERTAQRAKVRRWPLPASSPTTCAVSPGPGGPNQGGPDLHLAQIEDWR